MTLPDDSQTPDSRTPRVPAPRPSSNRPRRGLLIGGATVLLLAGAWAGSTVYSAGQAEAVSNRLSGTIDAALKGNNLGKVERHTFARGLTSSTDDIYLVLGGASAPTNGPPNGPMKLHLRNRIQNGPLPGFSAVGQAIVETEIVWDDAEVQAAVDKAFGGKKPNLRTVIGLGGNADSALSVPAGSYESEKGAGDQGKAVWQALSGRFQTSSAGRGVSGTLTWPGGSVSSAQGATELKDMRYVVDQQPYLTKLSQGKSSLTVASVTLPQGVGRMDTLNVTTTTAPSSTNPVGVTMQSRTQATVASLSASGQKFSDLKLVLSASRLSSAALEELSGLTQTPEYRALTDQTTGTVDDAALKRLLADLTPILQKLLAGNPELSIDEVSARTPQGRLKLALGAQVVNGDKIDLKPLLGEDTLKAGASNPALLGLLGNLRLSADIEGQEAVIAGLLGASGNDTAASLAQSIDPMIEQGMITRTGDTLKTHLEFSQSGATINGKPFGQ